MKLSITFSVFCILFIFKAFQGNTFFSDYHESNYIFPNIFTGAFQRFMKYRDTFHSTYNFDYESEFRKLLTKEFDNTLVCLNNSVEIKYFLSILYRHAIQYVRNETEIDFASLDKNELANASYLQIAKFKNIVFPCLSDSSIVGSNIKLILESATYTNIRSYLLKRSLTAQTIDTYFKTLRNYFYSYPYYSTDFSTVGYYILEYLVKEIGITFYSPSISELFQSFTDTWKQSMIEIIKYLRSIYGVTSEEVIFEKRFLNESNYCLEYLKANRSSPASQFMDFLITKYGSYYSPHFDFTKHKRDDIVTDLYVLFVKFFDSLYSCINLSQYSSTYSIIITYLLPKSELLTTELIESKLKYLNSYSGYVNDQIHSIWYSIQEENFTNVGIYLMKILTLAFPISIEGQIFLNLPSSNHSSGNNTNNDQAIRYSEYDLRYQMSYLSSARVNLEYGCLYNGNTTELTTDSPLIPFYFCIPINSNTSSISSLTISISAFSNTSKKIYSESRTANISLESIRLL